VIGAGLPGMKAAHDLRALGFEVVLVERCDEPGGLIARLHALYPDGRDATVTAGGKNMRFRNDTDHYIFIYGQSTGIRTKFYVWGVSDGRKASISFSGFTSTGVHGETVVTNPALPPGTRQEKFSGQNGLECYITRTVTYADGTTKSEKFKSRYPIIPAMIELGPAVTTTTGGPTTTTLPTSTTLPPTTTSTSL